MSQRLLIITYYWPPSGGPGVLRWVKFVKYLKKLGWEPVVYTAENADYPVVDETIAKDLPQGLEVLKQPIWEPYDLYRKFTGKGKNEKFNSGGFTSEKESDPKKEKLALWIRSNFFIPDARRFWVKPSYKYLKRYLENHPVDFIITTGPPHSLHLIGKKLKRRFDIPWIADFRDPWTKIYYYPELPLSVPANALHHHLEKKILEKADRVITVGETIARELQEIANRDAEVIHNGYDHEEMPPAKPPNNEKFRIIHTGNISRTKNQPFFWQTIRNLLDDNPELKNVLEIVLAGTMDYSVDANIREYSLESFVHKTGYLPHADILQLQQTASLLLLMISNTQHAKGVLTGKLFEYLASQKPIITIAPADSDLAKEIRECKAGKVVDFENKESLYKTIEQYYSDFREGKLQSESEGFEKFSRMELTNKLVDVLESIR